MQREGALRRPCPARRVAARLCHVSAPVKGIQVLPRPRVPNSVRGIRPHGSANLASGQRHVLRHSRENSSARVVWNSHLAPTSPLRLPAPRPPAARNPHIHRQQASEARCANTRAELDRRRVARPHADEQHNQPGRHGACSKVAPVGCVGGPHGQWTAPASDSPSVALALRPRFGAASFTGFSPSAFALRGRRSVLATFDVDP